MINFTKNTYSSTHQQTGATLFIGLILLLAISIISLAAMRTSVLDLIIANNKQQFAYTFEAAEDVVNQRMTNINLALAPATVPGDVLFTSAAPDQIFTTNSSGTPVKVADVDTEIVYRNQGSALGWSLTKKKAYHFQMNVEATAPGRGAKANHRVGFFL